MLDIDAKKTDNSISEIKDLNKISIDLETKNVFGGKPKAIFSGYLADFLTGLEGQSPKLDMYYKPRNSGYKILLSFGNLPFTLTTDVLQFRANFYVDSFTALDKSKSSISIETLITSDIIYRGINSLCRKVSY